MRSVMKSDEITPDRTPQTDIIVYHFTSSGNMGLLFHNRSPGATRKRDKMTTTVQYKEIIFSI